MLKSNTANKIISVIIAILLWTYVIGMVDPTKTTTIRDVPVQLLNEDSLTKLYHTINCIPLINEKYYLQILHKCPYRISNIFPQYDKIRLLFLCPTC
jgi:hypothetical protein